LQDAENSGIKTITLPVREVIHYTDEIFELRLEKNYLKFEPGQCVAIYLDDEQTFREYSIASGTGDSYLGFLIKHLHGGVVTEFLQHRHPGDILKVSTPYGWFRPGRQHQNGQFIFIATGTGIAPFLSYIRSFPQNPPLQILYGVRYQQDLVGLQDLGEAGPLNLAVSREKAKGIHHGRVTNLLPMLPLNADIHYYLCGLDTMVRDVTLWLQNNGIESHHIHREIFFYTEHHS
jgi:ferredoxin--NADP+ reductase